MKKIIILSSFLLLISCYSNRSSYQKGTEYVKVQKIDTTLLEGYNIIEIMCQKEVSLIVSKKSYSTKEGKKLREHSFYHIPLKQVLVLSEITSPYRIFLGENDLSIGEHLVFPRNKKVYTSPCLQGLNLLSCE